MMAISAHVTLPLLLMIVSSASSFTISQPPPSFLTRVSHSAPPTFLQRYIPSAIYETSSNLRMSSSDDEQQEEENEEMKAMRKMLQSSWNVEEMGLIPSNPADAAEEAASCIAKAIDTQKSSYSFTNNIFLIDLLLPSYDVTKPNYYDVVLSTQFCISLSKSLKTRGLLKRRAGIYLQGDEEVKQVRRVLDWQDRVEEEEEEEEEEEGDVVLEESNAAEEEFEIENVDDFRKQLMSSWDSSSEADEDTDKSTDNENIAPDNITPPPPPPPSSTTTDNSNSIYEVRSLLGDTTLLPPPSSSGDWLNAIVKTVDTQTVSSGSNDDDILILQSPHTQEEMIAVRRIISRYGCSQNSGVAKEEKVIVIVNCKLNPFPRELVNAELVYGILPLAVKSKDDTAEEGRAAPKAVVLKRYPKDWEVFIDVNEEGFESAGTATVEQVGNKRDPPAMDWIVGCMKMFMMQKRF